MGETPFVSTSIKRIKRRLRGDSTTEEFKATVKEAVNKGVDDFVTRLNAGEVKIDNVTDFEKLVKLGLLVHGEPTERVEETSDVEEFQETQMQAIEGTEEFDKIVKMLSEQMNENNQNQQ